MDASPSPDRGVSFGNRSFSNLFSKGRGTAINQNIASAASSIMSGNIGHHEHHGGLRAHFDHAVEKLKIHESSGDGTEDSMVGSNSEYGDEEDDDSRGRGLRKLIPRRLKRRQRRREADARASEEVERGRSVFERGTLENVGSSGRENSGYERYLAPSNFGQGDGSSMMTFESDVDAFNSPPALSTRPSQTGYLTIPLQASTLASDNNKAAAQLDGNPERASTFPPDSYAVATTETPPVPIAHEPVPLEGTFKRTNLSVERLAAALHPRRSTSPNSSPEVSKGGGLSGALGKDKDSGGRSSRRGSVASKLVHIFPDKLPSSSRNSSPDRPQTSKTPPDTDINTTPQTPPNVDKPAPLIVNTPPTPTDHSAPQFPSSQQKAAPRIPSPIITNPNIVTSPSGNMISHRRMRSGSGTLVPSKLSNITTAPLTPTPENAASSPQTGFFSSAWSAAQSAANTLSNTITNSNPTNAQVRSRSGTQDSKLDGDDVEVELLSETVGPSGDAAEEKELAVKTLGMGDLSLSHLGISETTSGVPTPTTSKFPENEDSRGRSGTAESLPARPAANTSATDALENGAPTNAEDYAVMREAATFPVTGNSTPPNGSVFEEKSGGIHRSGSVRSALGNRRRKRGSSAATGHTSLGTIGAAIAAANSSLANPVASSGSTPKLTGFAVASKKRNRDFHQLFRSVPEDDYLIEDYSCALQKEILAHGRLYVSEGHLCFSSNILGWVNTLVMSFDEIVSVEKRSTALVFRNGLMISTLHAKHIFASFTSRDMTYDLIVGIWKLGHPSLRSSLNGVRLDETGGDKTEKDDGVMSQDASNSEDESGEDEDVYDEDDDGMSFTQAGEGSVVGSETGEKVISRKASATLVNALAAEGGKDGSGSGEPKDYPGPATHAPTTCTDTDNHYDRMLLDEVIQAPLGKIYSLMFGPNSSAWMSRWLSVDQKCLELVMEDKKGLTDENKSRNYSYIKPLNGAIGPRQTKCLTTETLDFLDLERSVSVTMSTQTPDVPSGNVFLTKTRYCLSWAEGGATRLQVNCTIEWSGKSWLKGPIEKGANDGQIQYSKDLVAGLRAAISQKLRVGSSAVLVKGSKKKGKKGEKAIKSPIGSAISNGADTSIKAQKSSSNWGMLEPLHDILKPLLDIFGPLVNGNMLYGLLIGLLLASWFFRRSESASGVGVGYLKASPERLAAYEEIWRREESELWEWLEDRVGMERVMLQGKRGAGGNDLAASERVFRDKLGGDEGPKSEREIEDAIRVTEDKLRALKGVVERRKGDKLPVKDGDKVVKEVGDEGIKQEL